MARTPIDRRQLEDEHAARGGASRSSRDLRERVGRRRRRREDRLPAVRLPPRRARRRSKARRSRVGAQNVVLGGEGRVHRRGQRHAGRRGRATYVIIGHSERRQFFGETDETVNRRVKAALAHGLKPIICVGETLEQRQAGETADVLVRQTRGGLDGVDVGAGLRHRLRAGLGDRHRPRRRRRDGGGGDRAHPRTPCARSPATSPTTCASSTAAPSRRTTSPSSWRSRTSTAASSAAHRSRPTSSSRIIEKHGRAARA